MDFPSLAFKQLKCTNLSTTANQLFTLAGLLSTEECQACIDYSEFLGFTHQSSRGPAYGEAFRDNDRVSVQDQGIADMLWQQTGLSKIFKGVTVDGMTAVGCNPNIRFYRYKAGHRFGKHIDDSVELDDGSVTWYTLLVYLSGNSSGEAPSPGSGDCSKQPASTSSSSTGQQKRRKRGEEASSPSATSSGQLQGTLPVAEQDLIGGETAFYDHRGKLIAAVKPRPGLALLHMHGEDRCLEHEGMLVKNGTKYVLRSDVAFR